MRNIVISRRGIVHSGSSKLLLFQRFGGTMFLLMILLACACASSTSDKYASDLGRLESLYNKLGDGTYRANRDYVPNAETAVKIAEAVWMPIYGDRVLEKKPFIAQLVGDDWFIYGSLEEGGAGGVPYARIRKHDGKVLGVIHGR